MAAAVDGKDWWARRRRGYNLWLIAAGVVAFAGYCAVIWSRCPGVDTYEITVFTVVFQAIGYLLAMAVANVCYFLGTVSERILQPNNPMGYRRFAFAAGVAISVALPLLVPLLAYINVPRCH